MEPNVKTFTGSKLSMVDNVGTEKPQLKSRLIMNM